MSDPLESGGSMEEDSDVSSNLDKLECFDIPDKLTAMNGKFVNEMNPQDEEDLKKLNGIENLDNDICPSQMSNIDCSVADESRESSMTDCTVVFREVEETETAVDMKNQFDEMNERPEGRSQEEMNCVNSIDSSSDGKQILCAQELLSKTDHCSLEEKQTTKRNSERISENCDDNGLIEIDLTDTDQCESGVCCINKRIKEEFCSKIPSDLATCRVASLNSNRTQQLTDDACLETMLSGSQVRASESFRGTSVAVGSVQMNCYNHNHEINNGRNCETIGGCVNGSEAENRCDQIRDFCNAPTKMVFTSQRMKEYFETFKSRSGEKLRLYQFFKSTRTELIACLLLSLIVSQAQIVSRTQIQRLSNEWPFGYSNTNKNINKIFNPNSITNGENNNNKQGFVHFANGIATAFTVASLTQVFGHVSGCNLLPSISLALYFKGHSSRTRLVSYLVAQSIGPFVGVAILSVLTSSQVTTGEYWTMIASGQRAGNANNSQLDVSGSSIVPTSPLPIISGTQSSETATTSLTMRRRRRHAIVDDLNGTISRLESEWSKSKLRPHWAPTAVTDEGDSDEANLQQQQQPLEGSETILMSIEEEQKRQLQLKRQLRQRSNGTEHKPEAAVSSAEGTEKTISATGRLGTGTYTSNGIGNTSPMTTTMTTTTTIYTTAELFRAKTLDTEREAPDYRFDDPRNSTRSSLLLLTPSSSMIQSSIESSSDGRRLRRIDQEYTQPQSQPSSGPGLVDLGNSREGLNPTRLRVNTTANDSTDQTVSNLGLNGSLSSTAQQAGGIGSKLRRRKRNRQQQQQLISENRDGLQQNWSTINSGNNNNNWKSLKQQQPAPTPSPLPPSFSAQNTHLETGNGGQDLDLNGQEHYINLLEFALPDKIMTSDSIRQCISKQQNNAFVGFEQTASNYENDQHQLTSPISSSSFTSVASRPSQLNLLASRGFSQCLLLSNGSQMFILQLIATVIVVLTYLVNVDPRRDDLGFKSFSIGLSYFVACILTATSGGFYGNPFHLISLSWFSTTGPRQWESEWYIYLLTPLIGGLFGAMSHEYIDYTSSRNCNKRLHLRRSFYSLDTLPTVDAAVATQTGSASHSHGSLDVQRQQQQKRLQYQAQQQQQTPRPMQLNGAATLATSVDDDEASAGSYASSRLNSTDSMERSSGDEISDRANNNELISQLATTCTPTCANSTNNGTVAQFGTTKVSMKRDACDRSRAKQVVVGAASTINNNSNNNQLNSVSKTLNSGHVTRDQKLSPHAKELKLERKRLMEQQQVRGAAAQQPIRSPLVRPSNKLPVPTAATRANCCNGYVGHKNQQTSSLSVRRHSDYDTNFLISQPLSNIDLDGSRADKASPTVADCMTMMMSSTRLPDQFSSSFNASYM